MFIDSYIGYLKVERGYSAHTLRAYAGDLRAFREYIAGVDESLSFFDVDLDIMRMWVASLMDAGASSSSVCRKLSVLRSFYSYLRSEGVLDVNPVVAMQGPKRRKKLPTFIKESEMNTLIDDVSFGDGYSACRDRIIVLLFYETGIRLSELVGLDVDDVDMETSAIKVFGKRGRERIVPFASGLKAELREYLVQRAGVACDGCRALLLSGKGERITHTAVYRMVRGQLAKVSSVKKKSPHVLRHSFATAMLNNDAELGAVKELLGHRRLATTEIYTHLTFEDLKRSYEKAHPRAGVN